MPDCERLITCPFFSDRMANMPSVSDLIKETFCHGDKSQCARYQVPCAGLPVPPDLYPHDVSRAQDILSGRIDATNLR